MDKEYKGIVIAGTPGVGKSTVSKILADKLNAIHVDLSKLAIDKKLYSFYDEERQSYVIDEHGLVNEVIKIFEAHEKVIIDTHYPDILPDNIVDIVIILRLHPRILEDRLKLKNWPWRKIRENVLAEILSVVTINAIQRFGVEKVYEIDTTGKSLDKVVDETLNILNNPEKHASGLRVDWLIKLSPEEITKYEREEPEGGQ